MLSAAVMMAGFAQPDMHGAAVFDYSPSAMT